MTSTDLSWWRARWMASTIGLASIVLMLGTLVLMYVDRTVTLPEVSDGWSFQNVFDIIVNIGVPVLGIVIASRRPENAIGWLLLAAGSRVGADGVLSCVRPPRAGRRARLTSGRTGSGVDRERTLADPGGHAPVPLPALPDRTSVVASVEAGAMVRDRVARTAPGRHRRLRDLGVERAVHPRRHGSIGWILRAHAVRGRPLPPADRRWRVVRFGRGPVSRSRSGTSASSSSGS